jgi:hypothetical protein
MGRTKEKDRVSVWQDRVASANKIYQQWEKEFEADRLEKYYYGKQWGNCQDPQGKYVINLFFSTIETNKPSTLFYRPTVKVAGRPARRDDPGTLVDERAKLIEDVLNSFISDPDVLFQEETRLCLQESNFRFAVCEVGYTGDWIDNPNAGKPLLNEEGKEVQDEKGVVMEPDRKPRREWVYIKRIPARQWRVSVNEKNNLNQCDWCGYYEWHYPDDLKRNTNYKNTNLIKTTGRLKGDYDNESTDPDKRIKLGMTKIWKIWDIRGKRRFIFPDGDDYFLMDEEYEFLPFAALKFYDRLDRWYPMPLTYNWIDPQDEFNEVRDMERSHRRRAFRRYGRTAAVDPNEIRKLEDGGDMTSIELPNQESLWAIPDAPLDAQVFRNVAEAKNDFMEISGVGGEQRGIAEADTATQAQIVSLNSQIRDSYGRQLVSEWLGQISMLMLKAARNFTEDIWIKTSVDLPTLESLVAEGDQQKLMAALDELKRVDATWKMIKTESLEDLKLDISVNVESLSPQAMVQDRENWNQAMIVISNPTFLPVFSTSELLLRKTLAGYGIRSEREVREIQRELQQAWGMVQAQTALQQSGGSTGAAPPGSQAPAPGPTPDLGEIQNQVANQLGVGGAM